MRLEKQTRKELNEKLSRRALIQANASKRKIVGFGLAQTEEQVDVMKVSGLIAT